MADTIKVRLLDKKGESVAEKDMPIDRVQGVSVFQHDGKNYSFARLSGKFMTEVEFTEAGSVEQF